MPSLDAIGRYFPLTIFATAQEGNIIAPPDLSTQEEWFEEVERLLLCGLEKNTSYENFLTSVTILTPPRDWKELAAQDPDVDCMSDGSMLLSKSEGVFQQQFSVLRSQDPAELSSSSTFWWTLGGEGYPPIAIARRHMPDAFTFSPMLTGRFSARTV